MSKLLSVLIAASFAAVTFSAVAADAAMPHEKPAAAMENSAADKPVAKKKLTTQQLKMKSCNKEAKEQGLKKDERKAFMKSCLKKDKKDSESPSA